jgi:hypothetical protein
MASFLIAAAVLAGSTTQLAGQYRTWWQVSHLVLVIHEDGTFTQTDRGGGAVLLIERGGVKVHGQEVAFAVTDREPKSLKSYWPKGYTWVNGKKRSYLVASSDEARAFFCKRLRDPKSFPGSPFEMLVYEKQDYESETDASDIPEICQGRK